MNMSVALEQTFKKASGDSGIGSIDHRFCQISVRDRIAIYFPHADQDNASQAFKQII
jgi:hypothetical protein